MAAPIRLSQQHSCSFAGYPSTSLDMPRFAGIFARREQFPACIIHRRPRRGTLGVRNGMMYEGMLAETVAFRGHKGDVGEAYYARPLGGGPWPGVVLIHHMPGWDWWIKEATRTLAHHGFATIYPHLYFRAGPGSPDDVGDRVRDAGGVADDQVGGDSVGGAAYLLAQPNANGKVGVIGFCSGGRHAFLTAAKAPQDFN